MFKDLVSIFCEELQLNFPYLTSVMHQLALLQENDEEAKQTLQKLQADKGAYSVKIHPVETKYITEYNKKLLIENEQLNNKNRELFDQISNMRKNFNRDLNNRQAIEDQNQRKLAKFQAEGAFGNLLNDGEVDVGKVKYFDATDGIDKDTLTLLNMKISQMKEKFAGWQVKQLVYMEEQNKKLHMYQNMSAEFYGLINMQLEEIIHGLRLFEEPADVLWQYLIKEFTHEFFLPTIEKLYGHLFVNDTKRQQSEIQKAISQSEKNEKVIVDQCKIQIKHALDEKHEVEIDALHIRGKMEYEIRKAREGSFNDGKQYGMDIQDVVIEDLQKQILELETENKRLEEKYKDVNEIIEKEQKKTFFTKLTIYTKAKQGFDPHKLGEKVNEIPAVLSNTKILDFITGRTNDKYLNEMTELKNKVIQMQTNETQLIFETNTMKRKWKKLQTEKNEFEKQSYIYQDEAIKYKTKMEQQAEMFENYHQELTLHEVNLRAQGTMLKSVQIERDRYLAALGSVRRNQVFTKAQQVDTMLNATRAIIAFNGWTNYQTIKNKLVFKDKQTTTDMKGTQNDIVQVTVNNPNRTELKEATEKELDHIWKLPSTESGIQTDEEQFMVYLETIFPAFKKRKGGNRMSPEIQGYKDCGSQINILDNEQTNMFILDSLCNDKYLQRVVEEKRKYEVITNYEEEEIMEDRSVIGGINIREKAEKLPEGERLMMRQKILTVQQTIGVQREKNFKQYPELTGVYSRLWVDAGLKEEKMGVLRVQINRLIKDELEKKIHKHKTREQQLHQNGQMMNSFLEQIRIFINRQINQPEPKLNLNLSLEGEGERKESIDKKEFTISQKPQKAKSPSSTLNSPKNESLNFRIQFRERLSDEQIQAVCKFYIEQLREILKKRKLNYKKNLQSSSKERLKDRVYSPFKSHNQYRFDGMQSSPEQISGQQSMWQRMNKSNQVCNSSKESFEMIPDSYNHSNAVKKHIGYNDPQNAYSYGGKFQLQSAETQDKQVQNSDLTTEQKSLYWDEQKPSIELNQQQQTEIEVNVAINKHKQIVHYSKENQEIEQAEIEEEEQELDSIMVLQSDSTKKRVQESSIENEILRSKYNQQISQFKEPNRLIDNLIATSAQGLGENFDAKYYTSTSKARQNYKSPARKLTAGQQQKKLQEPIEDEYEGSANLLNFNFRNTREQEILKSNNSTHSRVGLRRADTAKSIRKPPQQVFQKLRGKKNSHDKSSFHHMTRKSTSSMINQQESPESIVRASTAQGQRLKSKINEGHIRQYSNSYLRFQLDSLNQLDQSVNTKNSIVYKDLKESISTGQININPLTTQSGIESIKMDGDMQTSREIPTRCDSGIKYNKKLESTQKSSVFDNKASDWKFNMQDPMQMIIQYQNSSLNQTNTSQGKFVQEQRQRPAINLHDESSQGDLRTSQIMRDLKVPQKLGTRQQLQVSISGGGLNNNTGKIVKSQYLSNFPQRKHLQHQNKNKIKFNQKPKHQTSGLKNQRSVNQLKSTYEDIETYMKSEAWGSNKSQSVERQQLNSIVYPNNNSHFQNLDISGEKVYGGQNSKTLSKPRPNTSVGAQRNEMEYGQTTQSQSNSILNLVSPIGSKIQTENRQMNLNSINIQQNKSNAVSKNSTSFIHPSHRHSPKNISFAALTRKGYGSKNNNASNPTSKKRKEKASFNVIGQKTGIEQSIERNKQKQYSLKREEIDSSRTGTQIGGVSQFDIRTLISNDNLIQSQAPQRTKINLFGQLRTQRATQNVTSSNPPINQPGIIRLAQ